MSAKNDERVGEVTVEKPTIPQIVMRTALENMPEGAYSISITPGMDEDRGMWWFEAFTHVTATRETRRESWHRMKHGVFLAINEDGQIVERDDDWRQPAGYTGKTL